MHPLLDNSITEQLTKVFTELKDPVELVLFTSAASADISGTTKQLLEEVTALSSLLTLRVLDFDADPAAAQSLHVVRAPTIVVGSKNGAEFIDHGIRLAGLPAGYEFSMLVSALLLVSKGDPGLQAATQDYIKNLPQAVDLLIFSTPT